jgi:myo-inositol 2-dehydrogenase / D-chiro-inositol 1-dehydrogenase
MPDTRPNAQKPLSRRRFLKAASVAAAASVFPAIIPSSVLGAAAPSKRVTVGCIGVGRMGMGDLRNIAGLKDRTRVVAVCDLDSRRAEYARRDVNKRYEDKGCASFEDYRELLARDDIDAVTVTTPDHWHAAPAIAAAKAGKAVHLQKPLTLTIEEGRVLADTVAKHKTVFQVGSQQRSDSKFRFACELVRNGRIGELKEIEVGFGLDPGCGPQAAMPVPENLNYNMWLGQAPEAEYTEMRVHPERGLGRPGWLRIRDYGSGMITGWGAHHLDIAQWGMGMERSGPIEVEGWGKFPESGLWNVHGDFHLTYRYANGVVMRVGSNARYKQGVLFKGSDGWVHVGRSGIDANPKSLLTSKIGPDEIHLYKVEDGNHMSNFVDCIRSGEETVAPAEIGHRSCSACLLGGIVMELGRKVRWNPNTERFVDDPEADAKISRPRRDSWTL